MAKVPGVPTLDPVNQPMESPSEAGKPGQTISGLASETNDVALTGLDFDNYLKKAQQHVDSLAAQNQLAEVYSNTQNQLSKTQNSRDVADVIQQSNKTLNEVSSQWSKSPASIQIQMSADALRPDLTRIGTVRQVDLMGKEFKITLTTQAEVLAGGYAQDRTAGGSGDMALGAFATAVHGGVTTGLLGDVEAQEYVRQFKQKGQELQIKNGITNSNPEVNQKTYDDISQKRDMFPDVTQEQLDTFKGQALSAFEAHTKFQDWAEGQMAQKTQLVPKIDQFTNPATGHFDEAGAMTDNAERMARGEITKTQADVLASGFHSHMAQLQVGLKDEAGKRLDDVEKDLAAHNFTSADQKLEANKPWFENNGFSDDYRAALRYTSQKRAEVRAEASSERAENRYEHEYQRQEATEQSQDQLGQVQHFISSGGVLTKADLQSMAGTGKGKMSTKDVDSAWKMMDAYEKEPDFAAATKYISENFTTAKTATADQIGASDRKFADTVELFQQQVNANPTKSKLEIAHDLVKSANEQQIKDHANQMFGSSPSFVSGVKSFFDRLTSPESDAAPKDGDTKTNSHGDKLIRKGGQWQLQP
jgi:hypothetical protein